MELKFRKAVISDLETYYEWVNDESVRQNSFETKVIAHEDHVKWFSKKIKSDDCFFYLFSNIENIPVGQVRIERRDEEYIIDVSIDKNFRGQSLASKILEEAVSNFLEIKSESVVYAYVKVQNESSYKSFLKAKFKLAGVVKVHDTEVYKLFRSNK